MVVPARHFPRCEVFALGSIDPAGGLSCKGTSTAFDSSGSPSGTMKASAISSAGGGKAVNNMQPFAVVQYIIALQGVYPSRS